MASARCSGKVLGNASQSSAKRSSLAELESSQQNRQESEPPHQEPTPVGSNNYVGMRLQHVRAMYAEEEHVRC